MGRLVRKDIHRHAGAVRTLLSASSLQNIVLPSCINTVLNISENKCPNLQIQHVSLLVLTLFTELFKFSFWEQSVAFWRIHEYASNLCSIANLYVWVWVMFIMYYQGDELLYLHGLATARKIFPIHSFSTKKFVGRRYCA